MRETTKQSINNILDVMTGVDGGAQYVRFLGIIEEMDRQASEGDPAALAVIDILVKFEKLITLRI